MTTIQQTIRIKPETKELVEEIASEEDRTISAIFERALIAQYKDEQ